MIISAQIALWADNLRGMSVDGLRHGNDPYDIERNMSIQDIVVEMLGPQQWSALSTVNSSRTLARIENGPHSMRAQVVGANGVVHADYVVRLSAMFFDPFDTRNQSKCGM